MVGWLMLRCGIRAIRSFREGALEQGPLYPLLLNPPGQGALDIHPIQENR